MMCITVISGVLLSGIMQIQAPHVVTASHLRTHQNIACRPLRSGQTIKSVVSPTRSSCFSVEVTLGKTEQLTITQPEDLEIHVRGKALERLVDGFDIGNETVTLQVPGSYRIEVEKVKSTPAALTISASLEPVPPTRAAAWEAAERWATMSKRSKKMDSINQSLALWTELGDTASIARTHLKRESVLRDSDLRAAVAEDDKALELCRPISDIRCIAEAANNSGWWYRQLGEVDRARERLDEAARDWDELHDVINAAKTRSNLGAVQWQSGDFEDAIVNLDLARHGLRSKDRVGYAKVLNVLGLCYLSLAEYEKARGYFERAISRLARGDPRDKIRARLNLGRTYMLEGHLVRAQFLLEGVLVESRKLSDRRAVGDSLRNLGQTLWREGNIEQARARFEEALTIDRIDGDTRGESSALHYLGLVAQKDGDVSAATSYLAQAIKIRLEIGLRDDAADSLSVLTELEYSEGKLDEARDHAKETLKLLESVRSQVPSPALRASFYSRKRQFFDLLVDMAMSIATPQSNVEGLLAAERGRARALMDLLASGSLQPVPKDLADRRENIQQHIDYLASRLPSASPEQQNELRGRIEQFLAEKEEIEAQIREALGQKFGQPLTSIEEIQHNFLPPNSALLEFHLGAHKSYVWLVDAQQVRSYSLPPAGLIEAQAVPVVKNFGRILERRRSSATKAQFEQALRKLSVTLLGELSSVQLPPLLILVPDGILHSVPFAALKAPDVSSPMGLAHDLVQIPSAAYLTYGKPPRPLGQFPKAILAVVDPVFSSRDPRVHPGYGKGSSPDSGMPLARLPFNFEIKTIESLVPPDHRKILRGFDASRAELATVNLADFGVLHFSTHAMIDDSIPELSRIMLSMVNRSGKPIADSSLHPHQLAQFHLDGSTIVLSACDTALGKQVLGEGLVGFTSSLLYAGGAQLVVTLTEIDAEASSRFLSEVYRRFLSGSNSMEHSIALVRLALVHDPQFSDPYFWASFIVVGRPGGTPGMAAYSTE